MKKLGLMAAAAIVVATASLSAPEAYAGPLKNNLPLSNGNGKGGGGGAWKNPHHYGHGGYWAGGLGMVGAGLALAAAEDCFYVRRRVFVPGMGLVKRRELVCG